MNEEMLKALREELASFKQNLGSFVTPDDLEKMQTQIEEKINESNDDSLKNEMGEVRKEIERLAEAELKRSENEERKVKTLDELLFENKDALAEIRKQRSGSINMQLKADVTRGSVTNHTLAQRLPDVGQLAFKATKLEPLFRTGSVGPNSNGTLRYVDQAAVTRAAAGVAEAAQKPESEITWQEYTLPIEVYADTIPVTMQAITQVDFVAGEINNFLANNLRLKIDTDLYSGDGVSPNMFGAYTRADTYTPVNSGITDANIYDLIVKVNEDIVTNTQYEPNYCILPHALHSQLLLKKDSQNNYIRFNQIFDPVSNQMAIQVGNILVIASASATANTMVIGDFNYAALWNLGGVSLDIGWIDKQFVENMMTIRAERQLGMLIRNVHTDAFRKVTDVAAALTTLATAPV